MATYNSSSISRGDPARWGVYPKESIGEIQLGNVTLTNGDILPICLIPPNSFISYFTINFPILNPSGTTLTISLVDNAAAPTTYILSSSKGTNFSAATTFSMVDVLSTVMGAQYGATLRAIGSTGTPVVVWSSGIQLRLTVTATASAATGGTVRISYIVGFSPTYDMGV